MFCSWFLRLTRTFSTEDKIEYLIRHSEESGAEFVFIQSQTSSAQPVKALKHAKHRGKQFWMTLCSHLKEDVRVNNVLGIVNRFEVTEVTDFTDAKPNT